MGRRLELFLALAALPMTAGVILLLRRAEALPLASAGYGILLAGAMAFLLRRPSELNAVVRAAAERERGLLSRSEELQARVEFLSAEREISLVLNEDVDFRKILDRVLGIACDTLGGDVELWMGQEGRLVLRARRARGETEFDLDLGEDRLLRQSLEAGKTLIEATEGRFSVVAPLQADREIVGVVRVSTLGEENAAAREERSHRLSSHLDEFSKFLALALKTPDLYTRAVQDGLTGLWTKRHFISEARLAIDGARRYGEPLSLILVDIDHFKKVNDTHGHVAGDKVLQGVAEILIKKVRGGSAFRYGGEEMAVLLPKADVSGALQVAERLRSAIEAKKIAGIRVTASFGVAPLEEGVTDPSSFVERADQALYRSKESGRNRVTLAEPRSPTPGESRRWTRSA